MKKFLFVLTVFVCSSLFAADIWETSEEIDVNGVTAEKNVVISDSMMKVENTSPNGRTETLVDLGADKITIVNHKYKSFQVVKLSKYIEFAQQLFNELKEKSGKFDPEKAIPKVTFEKQGEEVLEKWNCEMWAVSVDGKLSSLLNLRKNSRLLFRKILPNTVRLMPRSKINLLKSVQLSAQSKLPRIKRCLW